MNVEEYLKRQNELLERLTKIESEDFKTKKSIIQELIDATRPLLEIKYYNWPKKHFATFIHQQLIDYKIEYPRGETFYSLFDDDEVYEGLGRTNLSSLEVTIHEHKFESTDDLKLTHCECGSIQFESLIYGVEPPKEKTYTHEEVKKMMDEKPDPFSNPYTEYIQRVKFNCDGLGSYCNELIKKYYADENVAKTIESAFPKINSLLEEQKGIEAKLIHMGKQSDFRQKIGEFEKLKSIILFKNSTFGIAGVAKLLTNLEKCKKCGFTHMGISPKHQSVNILKNIDGFLNNMKWFRSLFFKCKKCQFENVIELSNWYDEQVERKNLGLEMLIMP